MRIKVPKSARNRYPAGLASRSPPGVRNCGYTRSLETVMPINELLLPELDEEMKKTRTTLERVPADKKEFAPHAKSMPLGKLAPHVAQLAEFGVTILTTPELDFSKGSTAPLPFESTEQLVRVFDEGAAKVRAALQSTPDDAWKENWRLSFQGKTIFEGSR